MSLSSDEINTDVQDASNSSMQADASSFVPQATGHVVQAANQQPLLLDPIFQNDAWSTPSATQQQQPAGAWSQYHNTTGASAPAQGTSGGQQSQSTGGASGVGGVWLPGTSGPTPAAFVPPPPPSMPPPTMGPMMPGPMWVGQHGYPNQFQPQMPFPMFPTPAMMPTVPNSTSQPPSMDMSKLMSELGKMQKQIQTLMLKPAASTRAEVDTASKPVDAKISEAR